MRRPDAVRRSNQQDLAIWGWRYGFWKDSRYRSFSAVIELPRFVLPTLLISVALLVRDTQAQSAGVSGMPLTSEMNDYTDTAGETDPAAKEAAVDAFLAKYPHSHAGEHLLEQLMAVYVREPDMEKVKETAARILSLDSRNLRADCPSGRSIARLARRPVRRLLRGLP